MWKAPVMFLGLSLGLQFSGSWFLTVGLDFLTGTSPAIPPITFGVHFTTNLLPPANCRFFLLLFHFYWKFQPFFFFRLRVWKHHLREKCSFLFLNRSLLFLQGTTSLSHVLRGGCVGTGAHSWNSQRRLEGVSDTVPLSPFFRWSERGPENLSIMS